MIHRIDPEPLSPEPPVLSAPAPSRRWRPPAFALVTAAVALIGLLVLLYPATAAWVSQYNQSQQIDNYAGEVKSLGPDAQERAIAAARSYNAALTGGASVAAGERLPLADGARVPAQYDYSQMLRADSTGLMARLKIPAIDVDLPIYHGTTEETLLHGVGHLEGTALPVGGESAHSVLTAHRGLASAELFTHLDRVQIGDTFTVEVFGEVLTYRVTDTRVVEPDQTESLFPRVGEDLVTLVTCTPLGINSHRILVTGERVTPTPLADVQSAGLSPDIPGFPWWALWLATGATLIGGYVWATGRGAAESATGRGATGSATARGAHADVQGPGRREIPLFSPSRWKSGRVGDDDRSQHPTGADGTIT